MGEAGESPAADPGSVSTLADLARELRILKVCSGNPSVRELAKRADKIKPRSLPHSTAQDAFQGNRGLPKLPAFLALLEVLGVDDPAPWKDAWTRAILDRQGLGHPAPSPRTPEPGPNPASSVNRIRAVNIQDGAGLIASLPIGEVVTQLADMPEHEAAERLDVIESPRVAAVLSALAESIAAAFVGVMKQSRAAADLEAMTPASAAEILTRVKYDRRGGIVSYLNPRAGATILAELPNPVGFLLELSLSAKTMSGLLQAVPLPVARSAVQQPTAKVPEWLPELPAPVAAELLTGVEARKVAAWLDACDDETFVALIGELTDGLTTTEKILPILKELRTAAKRVWNRLGEERLVQLLEQAPPNEINEWGRALQQQRLLSARSHERLNAAKRRR